MNLNEFLQAVEKYLSDLNITQKSKILSELSEDLKDKDLHLQDPKTLANSKRIELGLGTFAEPKKWGCASVFVKIFVTLFVVFIIFVTFLIQKFTPLYKFDEENERVTILGGLIDIDGKSGKLKIAGDVQFTDAKYTNIFEIKLDVESTVKILQLNLGNGKHEITTSKDHTFILKCKVATAPIDNIIERSHESLVIELKPYPGSCEISIPKDLSLAIKVAQASLSLNKPEFNIDVEMDMGEVSIAPKNDISYDYNLNLKQAGYIHQFESMGASAQYILKVELNQGSITAAEL